jgi:hypothetical protein
MNYIFLDEYLIFFKDKIRLTVTLYTFYQLFLILSFIEKIYP